MEEEEENEEEEEEEEEEEVVEVKVFGKKVSSALLLPRERIPPLIEVRCAPPFALFADDFPVCRGTGDNMFMLVVESVIDCHREIQGDREFLNRFFATFVCATRPPPRFSWPWGRLK